MQNPDDAGTPDKHGDSTYTWPDEGYTPPAAMPERLLRHATLRQFQVFEAIVRLGSFTKAAEELF